MVDGYNDTRWSQTLAKRWINQKSFDIGLSFKIKLITLPVITVNQMNICTIITLEVLGCVNSAFNTLTLN
jgi:hypothetical protein